MTRDFICQVMRECLEKNPENHSEVIFSHDDLYVNSQEGIDDKQWSWEEKDFKGETCKWSLNWNPIPSRRPVMNDRTKARKKKKQIPKIVIKMCV